VRSDDTFVGGSRARLQLSDAMATMAAAATSRYDQLRKQARQAETQLYSKLALFSKLSAALAQHVAMLHDETLSGWSGSSGIGVGGAAAASKKEDEDVALLSSTGTASGESANSAQQSAIASTTRSAQAAEKEIETLLANLSDVIQQLSDDAAASSATRGGGGSGSDNRPLPNSDTAATTGSAAYSIQRYQAIVWDMTNEFQRTRDQVHNHMNKLQLYADAGSPTGGHSGAGVGGGANGLLHRGRTDTLLRERSEIQTTLSIADESIQSAAQSLSALQRQQNVVLSNISRRVTQLGVRFPKLNQLMSRINMYKRRDTFIMAFVVAACIFFTLLYIWKR